MKWMRKIYDTLRLTINCSCAYLLGNVLLRTRYTALVAKTGRYFTGGRFGEFTAPIWRLMVDDWCACKKTKVNLHVPWPCSSRIQVVGPENISFHPDDLNNFQTFGVYYQGIDKIVIGHGTYIAPNVGLITANHDLTDPNRHSKSRPVVLGEKCWIGMNAVILPGVTLGDHTVVGAGSIVTKSFPEGHCVVAGNPAKVIKQL